MIKKYLYIGAGAAVGSVLRYLMTYKVGIFTGIHWETFLINISGCFILALFLSLTRTVIKISSDFKIAVTAGLLGAFTTFSAVSGQSGNFLMNGFHLQAFIYAAVTLAAGFASVYLGLCFSRLVFRTRTDGVGIQ